MHFRYGDNDNRLIAHGVATARAILEAAGGRDVLVRADTAHLMGGCRMGDDPETSVVDKDCRTHDVPNLFICSAGGVSYVRGRQPDEYGDGAGGPHGASAGRNDEGGGSVKEAPEGASFVKT